jgi:hypothetical protein
MLDWNVRVISNYCITHYACKGPRLKKNSKEFKVEKVKQKLPKFSLIFSRLFQDRKTKRWKEEKTRRHIKSQKGWKTEQGKDNKTDIKSERLKTEQGKDKKTYRKSERLKNRTRKRQKDRKTNRPERKRDIIFSRFFRTPQQIRKFFHRNKLFQTNDSKSKKWKRQLRSKPDCIWLSFVR